MTAPLSFIWAICKERNMIVFEEVTFSLTRLKTSFVSTFISWVGILVNREHSFVTILLCIL